jgi:predicted GIY-YIG superfamily endonuclease
MTRADDFGSLTPAVVATTDRPTTDRSHSMNRRSKSPKGHVYVIHLATRLHHAGHYVGFATDIVQRLAQHRAGSGARLMEVVRDAGIEWKLVKVLPGDRGLERRLKKRKNTPKRLCPVCRGEITYGAVDEHAFLPGSSSALVKPAITAPDDDLPY